MKVDIYFTAIENTLDIDIKCSDENITDVICELIETIIDKYLEKVKMGDSVAECLRLFNVIKNYSNHEFEKYGFNIDYKFHYDRKGV